jgi:hypothetical protein
MDQQDRWDSWEQMMSATGRDVSLDSYAATSRRDKDWEQVDEVGRPLLQEQGGCHGIYLILEVRVSERSKLCRHGFNGGENNNSGMEP